VLALAVAIAAPAHALSASELYSRLAPSVWVVRTFDRDDLPLSQGSAVVIGAQSLVTNCHVLVKAKRVEVTHEKTTWPATLELWDTARDLCQLKAAGLNAPVVALAEDASLVVGQTVYALGAPEGLELTLSVGIISALRHDDAQALTAIQTSAAISHGSSGGGLFDEQGRLVGITSAFVGANNAQNLNLVRPASMVRELPQRHAAAQAAKLAAAKPSPSPSPSPAPGSAPPNGGSPPASFEQLAGQWSGEFRCGAYEGPGKVDSPKPWNVPATMTVSRSGAVVMVRGDASYAETVSGDVQPDLSVVLSGRGAFKSAPNASWRTDVSGRFAGVGGGLRFTGQGELGTIAGGIGRHCSITLSRNPTP
jgi:hypothetical protein